MNKKIITLDLQFQGIPETIAAYLVVGSDGLVLIETGPGSTLATLTNEIHQHGYAVEDVKHVLVTHIHLDHAGAAGWWAAQGAQVYVHHIGAPHLIDPSKLMASASRIYGDQMDMLWGEMIPAPSERVTAVSDNQEINVAGLTFIAHNTPGHAWHHHTFQLDDVAFTGDAAGIRLAQRNLVDIPAPPPEFKLEIWLQTIDRLMSLNLTTLYATHFGQIDAVDDQLSTVKTLLTKSTEFVRVRMETGMERDELVKEYTQWNQDRARAMGVEETVIEKYNTANPLYMSVDGIMRYWKRKL